MTSSPSSCRRGLLLLSSAALLGLAACTSGPAGAADEGAAGTAAGAPAGTAGRTVAEAPATPAVGTVTDEDDPVATDAPRPGGTDVVLSYVVWDEAAGAVVAGGYVSPVIEDGGTCTLELTRDGESASATADAAADATTTSCGELQVAGDELEPGEWSAVLSYESDTASGTSEPLDVQVGQ